MSEASPLLQSVKISIKFILSCRQSFTLKIFHSKYRRHLLYSLLIDFFLIIFIFKQLKKGSNYDNYQKKCEPGFPRVFQLFSYKKFIEPAHGKQFAYLHYHCSFYYQEVRGKTKTPKANSN